MKGKENKNNAKREEKRERPAEASCTFDCGTDDCEMGGVDS